MNYMITFFLLFNVEKIWHKQSRWYKIIINNWTDKNHFLCKVIDGVMVEISYIGIMPSLHIN